MDSGEALEATLAKMQNFYAQHLALTALQVILTIVIIVVIVLIIAVVIIVVVVVLSVIVTVMLSDESVNCGGVWDTSLDFFAPKKVSITMMMMMMMMMVLVMM